MVEAVDLIHGGSRGPCHHLTMEAVDLIHGGSRGPHPWWKPWTLPPPHDGSRGPHPWWKPWMGASVRLQEERSPQNAYYKLFIWYTSTLAGPRTRPLWEKWPNFLSKWPNFGLAAILHEKVEL